MATDTSSAAPAKPAAPEPSVVARANQAITSAKTGFDPLRPVRYAIAFAKGTVGEGINGISSWGRKGTAVGIALGVLVGVAAPWIGLIAGVAGGALGGFGLAALGGGLHGMVTGGMRSVNRIRRAELYAEDLLVREKQQQAAPPNRADYRAYLRKQRAYRDAEDQRQFMERQAEVERDARGGVSWVDRVSSSNSNQGLGL